MTNDRTSTLWASLLIGMESSPPGQTAEPPLAEWTRRLAEGDDAAWRWFHDHYYLCLLRYAAHRSGDASAASEIVQQAYLRVARHARAFTEEADFSNWLHCVVRCAASDHTRHHRRRSLLVEKFAHWCATHTAADPAWAASASHSADLTDAALAKLPAADATLLRRKYCDGHTTDELARDLGTTAKAIEHRLARLRELVRSIILRLP
jgi:RNA polymerase sigma factor (sigma-70 family)